ncbi:ATP-binding protein [Vulcanimicrobium alpinum]|uniref:ATP-binding protein n=1 Tax=Vulcanimicrobium alpinum TaxID=3016050 RepID=UPI0038659912
MLLGGVASDRVDAAIGAAGEAIADAIEHAYRQAAGAFRLRAATSTTACAWRSRRTAAGRRRHHRPSSDAADGLTHLSERGRGLFLLPTLSAEASIERSASRTRVRFIVPR